MEDRVRLHTQEIISTNDGRWQEQKVQLFESTRADPTFFKAPSVASVTSTVLPARRGASIEHGAVTEISDLSLTTVLSTDDGLNSWNCHLLKSV
jgi:hypothetical protein